MRLGLGRQGLRLPPSAFLSLTLGFGSGYACLGYAIKLTSFDCSSPSATKKKRYFREKRAFGGTHIFPENGMFGFCSASAPQKQDLQKSTLHNTQLWCIFYPSAFGCGKCPITCVMYKPLRLWLRGSTFLQSSLRPTALSGVRPAAGVGKRANDRSFSSAFGWVALVGFASLAPWFCFMVLFLCLRFRSDHVREENCKRLCLSQFFLRQITYIPTNYTIFAL